MKFSEILVSVWHDSASLNHILYTTFKSTDFSINQKLIFRRSTKILIDIGLFTKKDIRLSELKHNLLSFKGERIWFVFIWNNEFSSEC